MKIFLKGGIKIKNLNEKTNLLIKAFNNDKAMDIIQKKVAQNIMSTVAGLMVLLICCVLKTRVIGILLFGLMLSNSLSEMTFDNFPYMALSNELKDQECDADKVYCVTPYVKADIMLNKILQILIYSSILGLSVCYLYYIKNMTLSIAEVYWFCISIYTISRIMILHRLYRGGVCLFVRKRFEMQAE